MDKDEAEALVASIKEHGLNRPIVTRNGMIIDGRNRYCACLAASVEPVFEGLGEFDDTDDRVYVIIHNVHRRHLSVGQRAMFATDMINTAHGGDRKSDFLNIKPSKDGLIGKAEAAQQWGISLTAVERAAFIRKNTSAAPTVVAEVRAGRMTLGRARMLAKETPEAQRAAPDVKFAGRASGRLPRPARPITPNILKELSDKEAAAIVVKIIDKANRHLSQHGQKLILVTIGAASAGTATIIDMKED
jgi:ParB-like nuclease domain